MLFRFPAASNPALHFALPFFPFFLSGCFKGVEFRNLIFKKIGVTLPRCSAAALFRLPHAVQLSGEATLQSAPVSHHAATSQHRSVAWPPATSQRCSPKNNGATPGSCHNHAATTRCCVTVLPTSSHLPNNHRGRGWNQAAPPNQPQGRRAGIKLTCPTNRRAAQPTNHRGGE